jgi:L-alanine-DL-glutamate epimerase-like enolase superfamily enzyme
MEHHSIDLPWWEGLVKTTDGRQLITRGFANLPLSAPGLGIELNEEQVKQHLSPRDNSFFAPTTEWDAKRAHDRTFS